jgi:hypothetical protein
MTQRTALGAARGSVARKLTTLLSSDNAVARLWAAADHDPQAAIALADSLDARIGSLVTGVALLRHEAKAVIEARKGAAA